MNRRAFDDDEDTQVEILAPIPDEIRPPAPRARRLTMPYVFPPVRLVLTVP